MSGYIRSNIHWLCRHNIRSVYCVCSAVRLVVASSFLFPLLSVALLSLAPSGTQHAPRVNTHKQTLPILPEEFMWDGAITSLCSIVSIAPHLTNTEKTHRKCSPQTFTPAFYFSFICN